MLIHLVKLVDSCLLVVSKDLSTIDRSHARDILIRWQLPLANLGFEGLESLAFGKELVNSAFVLQRVLAIVDGITVVSLAGSNDVE